MKNLPVLMVIASVLSGLGIVQMTFLIGQNLYRTYEWTQETRSLREEVRQLREDIVTLDTVNEQAQTPAYLEQLARCRGFVREAERVVVDERLLEGEVAPELPEEGNCETVRLP